MIIANFKSAVNTFFQIFFRFCHKTRVLAYPFKICYNKVYFQARRVRRIFFLTVERKLFHESNTGSCPVLADCSSLPGAGQRRYARPRAQLRGAAGHGAPREGRRHSARLRRNDRDGGGHLLPRAAANLRRRQGRSASAAHQRFLRRPLRRGAAGFPDDFRHIQYRAARRPR